MHNPDLLAAIHDLHDAIITLIGELREHRQAGQEGIEKVVALHEQRQHSVNSTKEGM